MHEPPRELGHDLDVVAGARGRLVRLADVLDATLARSDGAFDLAQRRRGGKNDVGELGRAREEEVLDDEVVRWARC